MGHIIYIEDHPRYRLFMLLEHAHNLIICSNAVTPAPHGIMGGRSVEEGVECAGAGWGREGGGGGATSGIMVTEAG